MKSVPLLCLLPPPLPAPTKNSSLLLPETEISLQLVIPVILNTSLLPVVQVLPVLLVKLVILEEYS